MKTIKVRQVVLGENPPKICIPLVGESQEELLSELKLVLDLPCQLIEWRADYFLAGLEGEPARRKAEKAIQILGLLRMATEFPIIFTIRTAKEGGKAELLKEDYFRINKAIANSRLADIIDIEAFDGPGVAEGQPAIDFVEYAHGKGVYVLFSNHDFDGTPDIEEMLTRFFVMQELGGDILKLAVTPHKEQDVVSLLEVTALMRDFYAKEPLITISMGEMGLTTRICGGEFGSAVTFASGKTASAPGQIDGVTLNQFISQYY